MFFTLGKDLQQILCQKNRPKLLPNSQLGLYQLDFSYNVKYIGKSKRRVLTRCMEHQQESISGKLESSKAREHTKECYGQFNWLHPETVCISPYMCKRKIREALRTN